MLASAALAFLSATAGLAQSGSYAPTYVTCPSDALLQRAGSPLANNQTLPTQEQEYLDNRRNNVLPALWREYLSSTATGTTGYNESALVAAQPNLGIAISGGGLRASLYGAGVLSAIDNRNSSTAGGLWQLATHLSGLSGGSWTVTSVSINNMPSIWTLVEGVNAVAPTDGWNLDYSIVTPGNGILGIGNTADYLGDLEDDVRQKSQAGFPISLTDLWGRALAYHFLNQTNTSNFYDATPHNEGTLFSSIRQALNFQNNSMPVPILVTTSRVSEQQQITNDSTSVIPLGNTGFEITPFSFGSFQPSLSAYIPIDYLGTELSNGQPQNSSACVNGFDNAGFMMGSSASLFNAVQSSFAGAAFSNLITTLLQAVSSLDPTSDSVSLVANFPNSFGNFTPDGGYTFESSGNEILQITDGGEDGQNVPLDPLLVKAREIDAIFAIDGSADTTYSYANGTSLIATSDKVALYMHNYTAFPPIPATQADFVQQGLNLRPTFFGCNSTTGGNVTAEGAYPLIIYLPNAPGNNPGATNYSTFKLEYSTDEVSSFLNAAHAYTLRGFPNSTSSQQDEQWPLCLKCAVVERARERAGLNRTSECSSCFDRYCWSQDKAQALAAATQNSTQNAGGSSTTSSGGSSGAIPGLSTSGALVTAAVSFAAGLALLA
ncbi:hypothetical protein JCM10908_003902 [Rhodotorula pacifica]|uniref:uncharacterized protein n=1 Tax=Rhodotorula pacifica TaxID=1495444 RepID=UPI003173941F